MAQTGNWTEERTTTQGQGDLTLSGATAGNNVRLRDSLQTGEVWYSISNGNNREAGVGTFDGTDKLQRFIIGATYENGIYNATNPSPLNLSGSSIVSCTFNTAAFKELEIGNPPQDGYLLSSTSAGVRTWVDPSGGGVTAWGQIVGTITDQADLQTQFNSKAESSHTHTESQITNLDKYAQSEVDTLLANKSDLSHTHTEIDIVGLDKYTQAEVDAKDASLQLNIDVNSSDISVRETAATGVTVDTVTSVVTPTTIQIAAGAGEIVNAYDDRSNPTETDIAWPLIPSITISMPDAFGVQTVYAQDDGTLTGVATILQKSGLLTPSERRTLVQIAQVYYEGGAIIEPIQVGIHSNEVGNSLYDYINYVEPVNRTKGIAVNAVTGALSIYGDAGTIFIVGIETDVDKTSPNIGNFSVINDINTAATFDVVFADGSNYLSAQTVMPEAYESAPNVATALSGNNAVIHYVYRTIGNRFIVQLGNRDYNNAALARDSAATDIGTYQNFTGAEFALLSAQVYLANSAADFSDSTVAGIISLLGGSGGGAASSVTIVDNLIGNGNTTSALSANQGYVLDQKDLIATRAETASTSLVLTDRNNAVEINNAGATTFTIDSAINPPVGLQGILVQTGSGAITFTAVGATTFRSEDGFLTTAKINSPTTFYHVGGNVWQLAGNLI